MSAPDPENPRALMGAAKAYLGLIPAVFSTHLSAALAWGGRRYGKYNWRDTPVRASTYHNAMERHVALWAAGEDVDPETGIPHLAQLAASCAIMLDAAAHGTLRDDRVKSAGVRTALEATAALMQTWPEARHELLG